MTHVVFYTKSGCAWGNNYAYQQAIYFPSEELYREAERWMRGDPKAALKFGRAKLFRSLRGPPSAWWAGAKEKVMLKYAEHLQDLERKAELERQRVAEIDRIGQEIEAL